MAAGDRAGGTAAVDQRLAAAERARSRTAAAALRSACRVGCAGARRRLAARRSTSRPADSRSAWTGVRTRSAPTAVASGPLALGVAGGRRRSAHLRHRGGRTGRALSRSGRGAHARPGDEAQVSQQSAYFRRGPVLVRALPRPGRRECPNAGAGRRAARVAGREFAVSAGLGRRRLVQRLAGRRRCRRVGCARLARRPLGGRFGRGTADEVRDRRVPATTPAAARCRARRSPPRGPSRRWRPSAAWSASSTRGETRAAEAQHVVGPHARAGRQHPPRGRGRGGAACAARPAPRG